MKKLILSAVFALACFTAQAKNEVIKNDDDKNPKNKAKVVITKKQPTVVPCTQSAGAYVTCDNGSVVYATGGATAMNGNCRAARRAATLRAEANGIVEWNN